MSSYSEWRNQQCEMNIFKASVCVNWGWLNPRCHVRKKNFIVTPERLVTRLNLFISIIPASSRTVKNLSPMTHPIPQNVFIISLPEHLISLPAFCGVHIARALVLCCLVWFLICLLIALVSILSSCCNCSPSSYFFVFTFSPCLWIGVFGYSPLIHCFGILLPMFYCLSSFQLEYISWNIAQYMFSNQSFNFNY